MTVKELRSKRDEILKLCGVENVGGKELPKTGKQFFIEVNPQYSDTSYTARVVGASRSSVIVATRDNDMGYVSCRYVTGIYDSEEYPEYFI